MNTTINVTLAAAFVLGCVSTASAANYAGHEFADCAGLNGRSAAQSSGLRLAVTVA